MGILRRFNGISDDGTMVDMPIVALLIDDGGPGHFAKFYSPYINDDMGECYYNVYFHQ